MCTPHTLISDSSSDSDSGSDSKGKEGDGSAKKSVKKPSKNLAVNYSLPEGSCVLLLADLIVSFLSLLGSINHLPVHYFLHCASSNFVK